MKNLIHYTLIAMMLNWNVAFAESEEGCKWETVEETAKYIQEKCGDSQHRIRTKTPEGMDITVVEAPSKKESPIKEFKDKVEKTAKSEQQQEEVVKVEEAVEETGKKVTKFKQDKALEEKKSIEQKVEEHIENKKLAETPVEDTEKPVVKEEIAKVEEVKKSDEKIIKKAEEKAWADVDADKTKADKPGWMQIYQMFPRLIVENEKVKAAELDYEAAKETLKSEYSAYYPQVTISIGQMHEDDRTPTKGTYPANTITSDGKHGIQKSITMTQMIWDAGRTTSVIDKAKHTAQQAYFRLDMAKEDVVMEGVTAWLGLTKAYNTWQANKKVENNAMITLQMTIEKVKKGEGSKLEQLQIEQQYRTYQTLTMTSKLAYDSARQRFQNVWRFDPRDASKMPMPIADLLGMLPVQGAPVTDNTALKIARMDIQIAREQLNFDKAEFKPRVDGKLSYTEKDGELAGGYDTDGSRKEEYRADVTMTWKIFGGFKNTHVTNADTARLRAAENRYQNTLRMTSEQFNNAWNNYVLVEKNLATLKRTVGINEEMYTLTLADFKAGNSPIMAVFGMKTAHLMSEVAYLNAQVDLLQARYQLHKVLGLVNPILQ
jgi:outer membrane protein TolC